MIKYGSLKGVEVKKIRVKDGVWVVLASVGFWGSLLVADWVAYL